MTLRGLILTVLHVAATRRAGVRFRSLLSVAVLCSTLSSARDQDSATAQDSLYLLDRTVVTATRTRRTLNESSASISVIKRQQIENSPAKGIDDLIMTQAGVQMRRPVGMAEGVPADVMVRGIPGTFGTSRTLVLVDGIPTNAAGTPFMILNQIPLEAVQRMEIVRGPFSSLYGANAFGGVINILTRNSAVDPQGSLRPTVELGVESAYPFSALQLYRSGSMPASRAARTALDTTYWNANLTLGGADRRAAWLVSGGVRSIGNYLMRDSALTRRDEQSWYKSSANHDYREARLFAKGTVQMGKASLTLHGRVFGYEVGFGQTKKLQPEIHDVVTRGSIIVAGPSAEVPLSDDVTLQVGAIYRRVTGGFLNEDMATTGTWMRSEWQSHTNDAQLEARCVVRSLPLQTVVAGAEVLHNAVGFGATTNPLSGEKIKEEQRDRLTNLGIFVQDELRLADGRFVATPGVRLDLNPDHGTALCPKLGLSGTLTRDLHLRASAGRAFRAPTFTELSMPDLTIRPGFRMRANPALKPEYIRSADGGVDYLPLKDLRLSCGVYANAMRDLVVPRLVPADSAITHANVSRAWSRGVECEAQWQPRDWMQLRGSYAFQKTRDESATALHRLSGARDVTVPLDYVPEHSASAGVAGEVRVRSIGVRWSIDQTAGARRRYQEWTSPEISFVVSGNEVLPLPPVITLDPIFRTDLSLSVELPARVQIALNIQNLFNAVIEESAGTLTPGLCATIKLKASL